MVEGKRLVLASASEARARLLNAAGLTFDICKSTVDEDAIRMALGLDGLQPVPDDLAEVLAQTKAQDVSKRETGAFVIGADQVLAVGGEIFTKPGTLEEARDTLFALRGQTHALHSGVCVARDGEILWSHVETAHMTMRSFSPEFVGRYFSEAPASIVESVGAYHYEGLGLHLFDKVVGDYTTVLGLPMMALLDWLRKADVVVT